MRRWRHKGRAVAGSTRIELTAPVSADVDALVAAVRSSSDLLHPWVYAPASTVAATAWIERVRFPDTEAHLAWADETLVAVVNINNLTRGGFQSGALGYYGFSATAGHGYVREAVSLVIARGFGELELHRLEANIQPGNDRSRKLVQALDFRLEGFSPKFLRIDGEWRDHERWAVVRQ